MTPDQRYQFPIRAFVVVLPAVEELSSEVELVKNPTVNAPMTMTVATPKSQISLRAPVTPVN